jgi:HlyD family secretion protein
MKSKRSIIIVILLLVAAAAVWYFFFRKNEASVALQTESPQMGYISQSVTATGNIQPTDTVTVGSQVSGIIKSLYTDFNAKVKKGQLLAQLDKSLFLAQVDQNKATLLSAQSQLTYQQSNFGRQELLYKTGAISKADYDNATYTLNNAKAQVENAKAQLASSEKNLSYTDIYSPMDGVVLTRSISVGQTVAASFNTPTFFTIAKDITKMQVQANVDEADIGNVARGQRATFTVDAFLDDVFQGSVEDIRLKPVTSANVVTYTTIIDAPNDDQKLKPGMTANVTIYTKEVDSAMLISAKALQFQPDSAALAGKYTILPDTATGRGRRGKARREEVPIAGPGQHSGADSITGGRKFRKNDTSAAKVKDSSRVQASEIAHVWILRDSTILVQKKIRTGLNNDTKVQVLNGLSASDVVVTGIVQVVKGSSAPTAKSPFMPQRPTRRPGGRGVR